MDLFGDTENKIKKVKKDSIYSRREIKQNLKLQYRKEHCKNVIVEFPENNEISVYISHGLSDAGGFCYAFIEKIGVIDEAYIATWTISKKNVEDLIKYLDEGKIKKLTFLLNDGMLKTANTKPIYARLRLEFDDRKDKVNYAVANSHAKVQAYRSGNRYCTISGSGNWSLNPRIEDYNLIGGSKMFNFTKNWINEIINE